MNYEIVKSTLLQIIKEAKNLPENELEIIPGTNVKVKKGKIKEFDVNAYFYFEHEHNMIIDERIDYITEVYNMLEQEVKEENDEYYMSKAYEISSDNKESINRLNALNKSLESINTNYVKLSQSANDIRNKLSEADYNLWKDKFDKINNDISELAQNKNIINNAIISIKKEVNEKFLNTVKEQMTLIEENFKNTLNGTEVAYALNGESVLASDLEEYNSLIGLLKIMNTVNESEKIISCEGVICINESQFNETKELFNKTNLFRRLEVKENNQSKVNLNVNNELINRITDGLRNIEEKTKKAKKKTIPALNGVRISENQVSEYNNLLNTLKILHQANDSKWELVDVNGIANVKAEDRTKFEELMQSTKLFNGINPDSKKIDANQKLIKELKKYLRTLEQKLNKYNGIANIPSRKTHDDTIVLKEDEFEYNTILEIISLLENSNNKLIDVWNIGYVSYDKVPRFKKLLNATKYFGDKAPKIEANEKEVENIKQELVVMIKKAKEAPESELANNGLVLKDDLEKYKLLEEQYGYLEEAKASDNLVQVNGVKVDGKYVARYQEIMNSLNVLALPAATATIQVENESIIQVPINEESKLTETISEEIVESVVNGDSTTEEIELKINEQEISKVRVLMGYLMDKANSKVYGEVLPEDKALYDLLKEKLDYLTMVKNTKDNKQVGNVYVSNDKVTRYQEIDSQIKLITNKTINAVEIEKIEARMKALTEKALERANERLYVDAFILEEDAQEYGILQYKLNILKNARTSDNIIPVYGVLVNASEASLYKDLEEQLNNITLNNGLTSDFNSKVNKVKVKVRKMKASALLMIRKNWKKILAGGLTATISAIALTDLIGNFGNNTLKAAISNLASLGAIGIGLVGMNELIKNSNIIKIKDSKTKQNILSNIYNNFASIKTNDKKYENELIENTNSIGFTSESDLVNAKIEFDNIDNMTESDLEVLELAENIEKTIENEHGQIEQRIAERIKKINSERETKYEDIYITSHIKSNDKKVIKNNKPIITIPSTEEILENISDKSLVLAQTDNYIDALKNGENAKIYRDLVFKNTGIDLNKYNMSDYTNLVQARSDVANAMNMSEESLLDNLINQVDALQYYLNIGSVTEKELINIEGDIQLLNERIDTLKKNERGM